MESSPPGTPRPTPTTPEYFDDRDALRVIRRKSTQTGIIVGVLVLITSGVLGWLFWTQRHGLEESRAAYYKAHEATTTEEFLSQLRALLPRTDYDELQVEIIGKLGQYRDSKAVPLLIEQLAEAGVVRRAAAGALATIGLPDAASAKPALLDAVDKTDARDRAQVVWALAVLQERAASGAILDAFGRGLLQSQPNFDPKVIVDAVGVQKLSAPALIDDPRPSMRLFLTQALAEEGSVEVVAPLKQLLSNELARNPKDQSQEVIRSAVAGLGRTARPDAIALVFDTLGKRPGLRPSVFESLRKSTSARGLMALLSHAPDLDSRQQLARMLAATHDPRATDTLAQMVKADDSKSRAYAAVGLAAMGDDRGLDVLIELASGDNDNIAMEALHNLRQLGSAKSVAPLVRLISQKPGRRASILRTLGTSGSAQAGPILVKELKGDDIEAAALALGELRYEPAYSTLLRMVKRPAGIDFTQPSRKSEQAYRNRLVAIQALGYYAKPDAAPELKTVIEDTVDDARLRDAAGRTLGHIADAATLAAVATKVRDSNIDERTRVHYAQALWQEPSADIGPALLAIMADKGLPWEIRRAAALGIGYLSNPANDTQVMAMLERPESRKAAMFAATLGGSEALGRKLLDVLVHDREALETLEDAFLREEADWFAMIPAHKDNAHTLRRLSTGRILRDGSGPHKFGFVWTYHVGRLKAGWAGPGGMDAAEVRQALVDALVGPNAELSLWAAEALDAMGERGILLAAREAGGKGAQAARRVLYTPAVPRDAQ